MNEETLGKVRGGWDQGRMSRAHLSVAIILAASSAALVASVCLGLPLGLDTAIARESQPPPFVDNVFRFVAVLWSPEYSLVIGLTGALVLLLLGAGRWAVSGLGFLLLVPVEVVLKLALERPEMPHILKPWPAYAIANFSAPNAVISGSPMRTGFVCTLWALVLWEHGGIAARVAAMLMVALNMVSMIVRVYGQYHWASAELGGELLGCALAFSLAPLVSRSLRARSSRAGR